MSKRSKEKKPAPLADWTVQVQGLVSMTPVSVWAATLRRHKDGSYTFRDADGAVVFDAPPMRVVYAQQVEPEQEQGDVQDGRLEIGGLVTGGK